MITNGDITYYHKDKKTDKWIRYYFSDVWHFGGKGSSINKGYENANDVNIRIPREYVTDEKIFTIGDLIVIGKSEEINTQSELRGKEFYNVTSVNINKFGENPHVHLGGK